MMWAFWLLLGIGIGELMAILALKLKEKRRGVSKPTKEDDGSK